MVVLNQEFLAASIVYFMIWSAVIWFHYSYRLKNPKKGESIRTTVLMRMEPLLALSVFSASILYDAMYLFLIFALLFLTLADIFSSRVGFAFRIRRFTLVHIPNLALWGVVLQNIITA